MIRKFVFLLLTCLPFLHATEAVNDGLPKVHPVTTKKINIDGIDILALDQSEVEEYNSSF